MKIFEWLIIQIVGPFLDVYIMIYGDDPEMIAYAGLAFVIYYTAVFLLGMAVYEKIREWHLIFRFLYWLKRRKMGRWIHRAVKKIVRRRRLENKIQRKIFNELSGEEGRR